MAHAEYTDPQHDNFYAKYDLYRISASSDQKEQYTKIYILKEATRDQRIEKIARACQELAEKLLLERQEG